MSVGNDKFDRAAYLRIEVEKRLIPHGTDDLKVIVKGKIWGDGIVFAQLHDVEDGIFKLRCPLRAEGAIVEVREEGVTRCACETSG